MLEYFIYVITITVTALIPTLYFLHHRSKEKKAQERLLKETSAGLTEPVSLHPKIDPNRCIGTGACVQACPEGEILGIIAGRGELVAPSKCIGHGACQAACSVDAIDLVFGSERRGVDIPYIKENFETNVPGIYIAGELGGMGLIRNAITQGKETVDYVEQSLKYKDPAVYDVAIIGAGPAGLAATLQAQEKGLNYITFEQDEIGGTVLSYPRQKIVMTQPMEIPLYGKYKNREIVKEELLELWKNIIDKTGIQINTREKLEEIDHNNGFYELTTSRERYLTQKIILSIGRRGTPRKLGVSGEKSSKVAYKLLEPEQYKGSRVLVIGGGDSAVEAALALGDQQGTEVILSYRKNVFGRIKERNRERIEHAIESGAVRILFESQVREIRTDSVLLEHNGEETEYHNDYLFVFIGGELPTDFLKKIGLKIEKKFGER